MINDVNMDELAEVRFADQDPQNQDPDAYNEILWLDLIGESKDQIDETLGRIDSALDVHRTKGLEKVKKLLEEAFSRLEDES